MKSGIATFALCALLVGCSQQPAPQAPLIATDVALHRPVPGAAMSAGYLTLTNTTARPIRINRVESTDYASVAMHESVIEDGVARMITLREVIIGANQSIVFEAGGRHLMLQHHEQTPDSVSIQFFDNETLLLSINAKLQD